MERAGERQSVDVEELLITAYQRAYVDRVSVAGILAMRGLSDGGASSTALMMAHVARGTAVDTSTAGATFAGRAGQMQSVEDDLIEVHDAVLNLPRFHVQLTGGTRFVVWDGKTLGEAHRHGWRVIRGGTPDRPTYRITPLRHGGPPAAGAQGYRNGVLFAAPGPVRAPEAAPIALQPIETRAELIANGRAGTRPDVSPLVVERYRPRYAGRRKLIGYDPVSETPLAVVALQRAIYAAWHCALALLVDRLQGLDRYSVTGPAASATLWEDGVTWELHGDQDCA